MELQKEHKQQNNKRSIIGIILIFVGIVLIAKRMDFIPYELSHILISWQMLLIGIGLLNIITKENYRSGLILISIGAFFLIPKAFDISHEMRNMMWPAILVVIGALMLIVKDRNKTALKKGSSDSYIDVLNVMGGGKRKVTSDNFSGGKVTSIFGGSELDLSSAKMQDKQIVIDVFTIFGGSEIIVPRGWDVHVDVTSIFGGFDDKRGPVDSTHPEFEKVLIIKGVNIFGGGEVKSY